MMRFIVLLSLLFAVADLSVPRPKLVIDNDAGGDDAMAIFLALAYEKHFNGPQLVGLTTANGNTKEDNVYFNNQRILKLANRQDVPIFRGSKTSIVVTPEAGDYFGVDGLGDTGLNYTDLAPAQTRHAVNALIHLSKTHKGNLTVVTIGTLTNVALAIKLDPDFLGRLAHLYVAAGHIHDQNNAEPEFNAHMDVEAYHIVTNVSTPDKVTFLPFSQVLTYLDVTRAWRELVLGAIDSDVMRAQNLFERITLPLSESWQALDPAAVAAVIKPDLVSEYKYARHSIGLCGDKRGITKYEFVEKSEANARIIYSVNKEEYQQFLLDVMSKK